MYSVYLSQAPQLLFLFASSHITLVVILRFLVFLHDTPPFIMGGYKVYNSRGFHCEQVVSSLP